MVEMPNYKKGKMPLSKVSHEYTVNQNTSILMILSEVTFPVQTMVKQIYVLLVFIVTNILY
jgi:hypothetical protein